MRKFSLLIALAVLITVGGVYAAWVYSQSNDVADISKSRAITMTEATFEGSYGTYSINADGLTMYIDPKAGTEHITALYMEGSVLITFTPSKYAPAEVKDGGVASKWYIEKDTASWTYNGQAVINIDDVETNVVWTKNGDVFTCEIPASEIAAIVHLAEIELDDKDAYDNYKKVLGALDIYVTDGLNGSTIATN